MSSKRPSTVNRDGASHRSGIEAEFGWAIGEILRLRAYYSYLDATEPEAVPSIQRREARRPRHSGSIAADGRIGRLTYGSSIAYVWYAICAQPGFTEMEQYRIMQDGV